MKLEKIPKIKYTFVTDSEEEYPLGMNIELKTTGFLGDDNSETYIKLEPNTCFGTMYNIDTTKTDDDTVGSVIFKIKGDWELQDTIDTLKWLLDKLEYVQGQ